MRVISIDIDGTALNYPDKVNHLFENPDHFIVLYTARSYSLFEETRLELLGLKIKYHALVMEKMRADVYIDDRNAGGLQWN